MAGQNDKYGIPGMSEAGVPFVAASGQGVVSETLAAQALREARLAGLLDGDSTEHISFRAPKALVEAAMRGAGVTSPTALGLSALALAAQVDPVAAYLQATYGALGADFELEY